jgi:hypothetical protein
MPADGYTEYLVFLAQVALASGPLYIEDVDYTHAHLAA